MAMDAQYLLLSFIRLIQENIIRPYKLPARESFDAYPQHLALVDCERVGILDFEGSDPAACPV